jgi:CRISPR system Cascade subunit CasB
MNNSDQANLVYSFVKGKTESLNKDSPDSRATLAKLRRCVGKELGDAPESWNVILDGLNEELLSVNGIPTYAEEAIFVAMTLFAVHQQGNAEYISKNNGSFGAAIQRLIDPEGRNEKAIKRRFDAVITAKDFGELAQHARGLIQLLKANGIALDYPRFAKDLFWYHFPDSKNDIRLRWGQDFYQKEKEEVKENENE